MDLARAIYKIDPTAEYLLNHSQADDKQVILEWRGLSAMPDDTMLRDAWQLCQDDDIAELASEVERQKAILRVKADPSMDDLVKVLRL
ncbi:MAG: hypothetical protein KAJ19_19640 [Gammaproteobacteria bacterium]|nr:hypothetical protein [Gammaproteobacteria bacterium]